MVTNNIITQHHLSTTGSVDSIYGPAIALTNYGSGALGFVLRNNIISNNSIAGTACEGGAVWIGNYNAKIIGNQVINNISEGSSYGIGAIVLTSKLGNTIQVEGNRVIGNSATTQAGALQIAGYAGFTPPTAVVQNNIIAHNSAPTGAGIRTFYGTILTLINNTISDNSGGTGNGINATSGQVRSLNNIFANGTEDQIMGGATMWFDVNLIYGQNYGSTNINANPAFIDTDFHLHWNSPAIDTGEVSLSIGGMVLTAPTTDIDGNPRVGKPDLGAYEYDALVDGVQRVSAAIPTEFSLDQNFPNPFNPSTTIPFTVHRSLFTTLRVFDVLGREVATLVSEELSPGTYSVEWDASGMPSGAYLYRLEAGGFVEAKRMILIR